MKTENNILRKVNSAIASLAFFLISFSSFGQCDLACNGAVQVSLDNDCNVEVTVDMVFEGTPTLGCSYSVSIEDASGNTISSSPFVNSSHIGETLTAVIHDGMGNTCWGTITVEDKLPPSFNCPDDQIVLCYNTVAPFTTGQMSAFYLNDNCGDATVTMTSDDIEDVDCMAPTCGQVNYATPGGLGWVTPGVTLNFADPNCAALAGFFVNPVPSTGSVNLSYTVINMTITDPGAYSFVPTQACDYVFNIYPTGTFNPADPCNTTNLLAFGGYSATNGISQTGYALLTPGSYEMVVCSINTACTDALAAGVVTQECTGNSAVRTICYVAEDASGNLSDECCYNIYYARVNLYNADGDLNVIFPANQNVHCNVYPTWNGNLNGMGVPQINDGLNPYNIYPNTSYCELNATYSDVIIELCGSEYKVVREWTVLDWCTGEVAKHNQIIKIEQDPLALTSNMGCDLVGSSDPYACEGSFQIPSNFIQVLGICSGTSYTYEVYVLTSGDGFPQDGDSGDPADGIINSCDCPNTSPGIFTQFGGTYTSLSNPPNLTGLSYGCNWVKVVVTTECNESQDISFEVLIEDNTPPNPVCDEHTVVTVGPNGWAVAQAESFDDGSFDFCSEVTFGVRRTSSSCNVPGLLTSVGTYGGRTYYEYEKFCCSDIGDYVEVELVVVDESGNWNVCTVEVWVQDLTQLVVNCPTSVVNQDRACGQDPLATTGPTLTSAICTDYFIDGPHDSDPFNVQDCGDYSITRRWFIRRGSMTGPIVQTCPQTIIVNNTTVFNGNSIGWPGDFTDNDGCMASSTDPSMTGSPTFSFGDCSNVADTYTDQVFNFVDDACFKILRTWTVIDWCQYDTSMPNGPGIWQHVQVIKVNDNTAPQPIAENQTIQITSKTGCSATGGVSVNGNDNCGNLTYSYSVNGGGFVSNGSNNSFSTTWNEGTHTVTWVVEDACGNSGSATQTVNVVDAVAPTPYCLGSVTTVLMESTSTVQIWASDFDLGSEDNCDNSLQMTFANGSSSITFDCSHLGTQLLQVYFTDDAGNSDFCTVEIDIQDNLGACDNNPRIAGSIYTEENEMVEDVEVMLHDKTDESYDFTQTQLGSYSFDQFANGHQFEVSAERNDDYMNGVSTLDLVLIQKHILQDQMLNSPYKVIAADINGNGDVSAIDLIQLRKLILGIYTELPDNLSWRFVDASQNFNNANSPWPFTEVVDLGQVQGNDFNNDFVAVKIGDVNNTVVANIQSDVTVNRSSTSLDLVATSSANEDLQYIEFAADNFEDILGLQTTIEFDQNLVFESIQAGAIELTQANVNPLKDGKVALSWHAAEPVSVEGEVLFTLVLRAKTNYNELNLMSLSSEMTKTEAYTSNLEVMDVTLRNEGANLETEFAVFQNTPNPFSDNTSISFNLPERASVTLTLYDVTGKVINTWTNEYENGLNSVNISSADLNAKGVIYYRIDTGSHTATRKMISL